LGSVLEVENLRKVHACVGDDEKPSLNHAVDVRSFLAVVRSVIDARVVRD
jgi:hypothetical protein